MQLEQGDHIHEKEKNTTSFTNPFLLPRACNALGVPIESSFNAVGEALYRRFLMVKARNLIFNRKD